MHVLQTDHALYIHLKKARGRGFETRTFYLEEGVVAEISFFGREESLDAMEAVLERVVSSLLLFERKGDGGK